MITSSLGHAAEGGAGLAGPSDAVCRPCAATGLAPYPPLFALVEQRRRSLQSADVPIFVALLRYGDGCGALLVASGITNGLRWIIGKLFYTGMAMPYYENSRRLGHAGFGLFNRFVFMPNCANSQDEYYR